MQDKKKPVFLVMTANQVEHLPPEFLRRGRFDEIFATDLPYAAEREQIAKVVLKRVKRDPKKFDLAKIAAATDTFTGAEIEACVTEALFSAFDNDREVSTADVIAAAGNMIPISKMMAEKIEAIRKWGEGRARPASLPQAAAPQEKSARKIKA
jgi:SpoVK/Ycf46/Vps4 family AAA+-type ATPase